jgi:hypothetical protein
MAESRQSFSRGSDVRLEPVTLRFDRHHEFVGKRVKNARCAVCKRGQHFIEHLGYPEQLDSDSGTDPLKWQDQKRVWQEVFGEALHLSGLPRGVFTSVTVTARYRFPNRNRRDRDNLIYPMFKFLGDTLVRGRYWELPHEAIDWSDGGMVASVKTGKPMKTHRRLIVPAEDEWPDAARAAIAAYGRPSAFLEGRPSDDRSKPVTVRDPLGGWIADDSGDQFQVIDVQGEDEPGPDALSLMLMPSLDVIAGWPSPLTAR